MRVPFIHRKQDRKTEDASCHGGPQVDTTGMPLVAIVGCPNVGKSVLFNALTGAYVTVSNFPGTTVEVSRGKGHIDRQVGVVDTPGMYSLLPITAEERVGRRILLEERPDAVVHVVDAKNLERMLPMTLQLIEAGLPVVLDVNLMDEARRMGVQVDVAALERELGVPVVATTLTRSQGVAQLKKAISSRLNGDSDTDTSPSRITVRYHPAIEGALQTIGARVNGTYCIAGRAVAMLVLQQDEQIVSQMLERQGAEGEELLRVAQTTRAHFGRPISYVLAQRQHEIVGGILARVMTVPEQRVFGFAEWVQWYTDYV